MKPKPTIVTFLDKEFVKYEGDVACNNQRFSENIIIEGNLKCWGNYEVYGDLIVRGNISIDNTLIIHGNLFAYKKLEVGALRMPGTNSVIYLGWESDETAIRKKFPDLTFGWAR